MISVLLSFRLKFLLQLPRAQALTSKPEAQ